MALRVAVVIPPLLNLNAPYASAPRLAGWLRSLGHEVAQVDLSLEVFLRVCSRAGLAELFALVEPTRLPPDLAEVYANRDLYIGVIDELVAFLQGRASSVAHRLVKRSVLPRGPSMAEHDEAALTRAFGRNGITDRAKFLAAKALRDLTLVFRHELAPDFGMSAYATQIAAAASGFDALATRLAQPPDPIERYLGACAEQLIGRDTDLVAITCPFPGNLVGSLRLGAWLRQHRPGAAIALGGGYPSTELRDITDPRPFDFFDYLVLDDGELPLQQICERRAGRSATLYATFTREDGRVVFHPASPQTVRFRELPTPDYRGLPLDRYIDLVDGFNPVYRLWTEGRWQRLTAAHGCYWKKCTFCDIHLAYIADFDALPATALADQMDEVHAQTGLTGFHFTDEAAPPPLLVNLALELLRRDRHYHFWGNIRFDPGFTRDRCRLLAAAGMIAVTGGLEVASDRILPVIDKGVTIAQATRVCRAFTEAGILCHAYLMHSFPGETLQDTSDALELVRQLMKARVLHSAAFHKFVATAHSPIGREPGRFGVRLSGPHFAGFARYAMSHEHAGEGDWPLRRFSPEALKLNSEARLRTEFIDTRLDRTLESFLAGERLDGDVTEAFDGKLPPPSVSRTYIQDVLDEPAGRPEQDRMCWLGERSSGVPAHVAELLQRSRPRLWPSLSPPRVPALDGESFELLRAAGVLLV